MAKQWIEARPLNRESEAMLRYILSEVRRTKQWTYEKAIHHIPPSEEEEKVLFQEFVAEWLDDYLFFNPVAKSVPAYTLRRAITEILEKGAKKEPEETLEYSIFYLPARKGWSQEKKKEEQETSWKEFNFGEEGKRASEEDTRIVTPQKAERELLEAGILRWKWGGFFIVGNLRKKLRIGGEEEFLRNVEAVWVRRVQRRTTAKSLRSDWKIHFERG